MNEKKTVEVLYNPLTETQLLFNNPKLSDVRFLVDGETVYGHKQTLALGSPVFESMFFGELKEQREVIEIRDLTAAGFKNALRYVYGFKIDCELSELHESYVAADKYLLHHYSKMLFEFIRGKLNAVNSCLIYEQLIKIGDSEVTVQTLLARVRSVIMMSKEAIESEHFRRIDQETLISLLSLEKLSIDEIDLFRAVSKWIDCEVQRRGLSVNRENRRLVFEPIKGYILFTYLSPQQIAKCKEIVELFTEEELLPLLLHLLNKTDYPLKIQPKTPRKARTNHSFCRDPWEYETNGDSDPDLDDYEEENDSLKSFVCSKAHSDEESDLIQLSDQDEDSMSL